MTTLLWHGVVPNAAPLAKWEVNIVDVHKQLMTVLNEFSIGTKQA